ncbi:MAG: glycoside hydrolase family 25 protein [Clostridiales bacterium]
MKGIDVSKYQREIQWDKVAAAGMEFAIVRSSWGREAHQVDPFFYRNYQGAQKAGLHVGAYHYSYAKTVEQARQEAAFFLDTIKGLRFSMPVYYDLEDPSQASLTREEATSIAEAFCCRVEAAGYFVGIYANVEWLNCHLDMKKLPYTLWLAQWGSQPGYQGNFDLWQHSSKGRVPGINGPVDLNLCLKDFPGLLKASAL